MSPHTHLTDAFRSLCRQHGITATHQRQAIYECIMESTDHPTPEMIFERVRRRIPIISLATVYNCVHTFLRIGVLKEASPHHGSVRVDPNVRPHHHVFCRMCGSMIDITDSGLDLRRALRRLPRGFHVEAVVAEVIGTCAMCGQSYPSRTTSAAASSTP